MNTCDLIRNRSHHSRGDVATEQLVCEGLVEKHQTVVAQALQDGSLQQHCLYVNPHLLLEHTSFRSSTVRSAWTSRAFFCRLVMLSTR